MDRRDWGWGGTGTLKALMVGVGVMEQSTFWKLSCCLAREAETGSGGAQGFTQYCGHRK